MEEMILAGRITVNRMPAEIGQKVSPGDEVRINGELVKVRFAEPRARILMYHKPAGELVTRDDPEGRPTVFEKLPSIGSGKWISVGRLDYNTEGLLLFTNSGELANRMMHPRYEVEREYAVRVMGRLAEDQIKALTEGVQLEDGLAKCESVEDGGGDEEGSNHWYRVVLKEGRNREVRRLFEALGLMVSRLIRTRFGPVPMPARVKRGDVCELEPGEVQAVLQSAGMNNNARPGGNAGGDRNRGPQRGQANGKGGRRQGRRPGGGPRPGERAPAFGAAEPHAQPLTDDAGEGMPQRERDSDSRPPRPNGQRPQRKFGKQGGRPHNKGPRPQGGPGAPQGGQRPPRERHNFDEVQPISNANASPFATRTLTAHNKPSFGGPGTSQRTGPRAKKHWAAQGQGGGKPFGNKGPHRGPKPPREVNGNVGSRPEPVPIDDES